MVAKYKSKSNGFILAFLVLKLAGLVANICIGEIGILISVIGSICLIVGCCYYSKGKGHNAAWGLLGILSIIGLIVLVCFPDKCKEQQ